ncbi:hypothetical protein HQ590_06195 [bacterium]|nr:hypothetical protein [bacterium]
MRAWKFWLLLVVIAAVVAFGGYRLLTAFRDRAPAKFAIEPHRSASIARGSDPDLAWNQLSRLLKDVQRTEQALELNIGSVQFVELDGNPSNSVFWSTVKLVTPGFDPLTHFEDRGAPWDTTVLGFYLLDGEALRYSIRRDPGRPQWRGLTVHLRVPLPPGETLYVWRRERRRAATHLGQDGLWRFAWGQIFPFDRELQARGVRLPAGASLVDHNPKVGTLLTASGTPMVGWVNVNLERDAPAPAVTYRLR